MKTYYCVTSSFYDDGRVTAAITDSKTTDSALEDSYTHGARRDIYIDWYDSYDSAYCAVCAARNA
jgi:hypothetical protein